MAAVAMVKMDIYDDCSDEMARVWLF